MRYVPAVLLLACAPLRADDLGLKVPPGFRVTLWADHTLANDIFTMALDETGRVVVSGPGYVRRLEDTDGDGKADRATDIAETKTGAMGMLFTLDGVNPDKFALYMSGDGRIAGHKRQDGDPEFRIYDERRPVIPFSEHGGHSLKLGPDGRLHAVAGNDSRLNTWKTDNSSVIQTAEGGGIVRFYRWILEPSEIIAHGFRNPYDFDFTPLGDLITYDSDTERDYLLPWYMPTRVYHVLPGAHHGWRLSGYMRSLARRDYYPDTVPMLADMGRGSPTGVCCYRHTQFPKHYRGGVFLLDWTFGKVYYLPLVPEGSSYKPAKPEVFLEPTGQNGFAPTAARVAPDGSLFISVGGRGTRGAVYRVEYLINGEDPVIPPAEPGSDLDRVLNAPQPLEAWSLARWLPLVEKLPVEDIERIALDENETIPRRVRAIEVLVYPKQLLDEPVVDALLRSAFPMVRAKVAWAMGLTKPNRSVDKLWPLTSDTDPRVRAEALVALSAHAARTSGEMPPDVRRLRACLGDSDRRVRLAAAGLLTQFFARRGNGYHRLLTSADSPLWKEADTRTAVSLIVARAGAPAVRDSLDLPGIAWQALDRAETISERLDALRAVMLVLGDWNVANVGLELHSAYSSGGSNRINMAYHRLLMSRPRESSLFNQFPSADDRINVETARLLAMLESDYGPARNKFLYLITADSHPTLDFHYLTATTRLSADPEPAQLPLVANALLGLEAKLAGRHLRIKQNWAVRLGELVGELLKKHPGLDKFLAAHPDLVKPGHVVIAAKLTGEHRNSAARRFLDAAKADEDFPLTAELIDLVAGLPAEDVRPVLRSRWADRSAREAIVRRLAAKPDPADRLRFLEVLDTASGDALKASLDALAELPRDDSPKNLVPLLARLRQSFSDTKEVAIRKQIVSLVNRQAGKSFGIKEPKTDPAALATAYRSVFAWFETAHPAEAKRLNAAGADEEAVRKLLPSVKWDAGDMERGRKLYRDRGCQACHGASARVAPDLAGVGKRFSRDDLLTALLNPSRDVAPAYRLTNVDTRDGKRISGAVVFESADGLIVQTATDTRRLPTADIEARTPSPKSLMPDGLLNGLRPEDLADLFAFLAQL